MEEAQVVEWQAGRRREQRPAGRRWPPTACRALPAALRRSKYLPDRVLSVMVGQTAPQKAPQRTQKSLRTLVLHAPLQLDDDGVSREIVEKRLGIHGNRLQAGKGSAPSERRSLLSALLAASKCTSYSAPPEGVPRGSPLPCCQRLLDKLLFGCSISFFGYAELVMQVEKTICYRSMQQGRAAKGWRAQQAAQQEEAERSLRCMERERSSDVMLHDWSNIALPS